MSVRSQSPAVLLAVLAAGCGTTRTTDTARAASEMLLVSQAIDHAVADIDFAPLANRPVFFDTQYLDGTVDKGYLVSSIRQRLLASGALLMDDRQKATYVVEARSGGVGTDHHNLLIGVPAMSLPTVPVAAAAAVPSTIPEMAAAKQTDQKGVAKIAVFAYNRQTGRALWQSGLTERASTLKDLWVLGAGPYSSGSVLQKNEFAGSEVELPKLPFAHKGDPAAPDPLPAVGLGTPHLWTNSDVPGPRRPVPGGVLALVGGMAEDPAGPPDVIKPAGAPVANPVVPAGMSVPEAAPRPMKAGAKP